MIHSLKPEQLRRSYDFTDSSFQTTAEMPSGTNIIGQPRGVQAIEFGLSLPSPGYNIFVLGESGTGRTTAIQKYIEQRAESAPVPSDWVYLHNFLQPDKPSAIELPAGVGCRLRDVLHKFVSQLRNDIRRAFDNQVYRDAVLEISHELDNKRGATFDELQQKASAQNAMVLQTAEGFRIVPTQDGQPMQPQEYNELSEDALLAWKEILHKLQHELNETAFQSRKLETEAQAELDGLNRRVGGSVVDVAFAELKQQFADFEKVTAYLDEVQEDILDHVEFFQDGRETEEPDALLDDERFWRYQVNVLVDHKLSKHAPVIVDYNATVPRLLGRVEHEVRQNGAVVTDFTLIRSGVLHTANGGYLVLRARDLFNEPGAWEALKRALVAGEVRPDDPATRRGSATRTLDPEPIPLNLKVVLIGPPQLYYYLHQMDEDFQTIFKVMADFDEVVDRTPENELLYATFVATRCHDEGLLHLDREAVARVIEYGSRLAGTQSKLSTRFGQIADLVRESNYWTGVDGRSLVTVNDVEKAIDNREYLRNRIENRMRAHLLEGKQLVATAGAIVGQINGLSVSQVGDHAFGHPTRVTTRTYVGQQGVVQIDREVELAGQIHNKGLMTLVGYLGGQYAADQPLSLSAQITFEQNYGGIDGDSASSTELYALLSSLSGFPINQSIAVTGSVNQRGEIQAIGGVTQKVEGWFNVCKANGLTGEQGVIIPISNVSDLMLRVSVVEAVAAGQFHIWAVTSVDEGITLLTGRAAEDVHESVKARLQKLANTMAHYNGVDLTAD